MHPSVMPNNEPLEGDRMTGEMTDAVAWVLGICCLTFLPYWVARAVVGVGDWLWALI